MQAPPNAGRGLGTRLGPPGPKLIMTAVAAIKYLVAIINKRVVGEHLEYHPSPEQLPVRFHTERLLGLNRILHKGVRGRVTALVTIG